MSSSTTQYWDPATGEIFLDKARNLELEKTVFDACDWFDRSLVGLEPLKLRLREIGTLYIVDAIRELCGTYVPSERVGLHFSFVGNPGTGKTIAAKKLARVLFDIGYLENSNARVATRDDLVGKYIGHTAPKTRQLLEECLGGVLILDDAYYIHKPNNPRDFGSEVIEVLLKYLENRRHELVVIFAGYEEKMKAFYGANPGLSSRVTNHIYFPDFTHHQLLEITCSVLQHRQYRMSTAAFALFSQYLRVWREQPFFSNARTVENGINALVRLHAARLFKIRGRSLLAKEVITFVEQDLEKLWKEDLCEVPVCPTSEAIEKLKQEPEELKSKIREILLSSMT